MTSRNPKIPVTALRRFLESEAAAGVLLMAGAALALIVANSPLAPLYVGLLSLRFGPLNVLQWINDAAMAGFFLLVGLEIKRELLIGHLRRWPARVLPGAGALGGMILPALIYLAVNFFGGGALKGWAVPAATDIAFALGVLALLGPRAPAALKVFLTALAILDDLGAAAIIGIFYSSDIALGGLVAAGVILALVALLGRYERRAVAPYLSLGVALWAFVLASGVHPTLAGVLLAAAVPMDEEEQRSPLHQLEKKLTAPIAFFVLPLFGFANAGLRFSDDAASLGPVFWGVALGLFLGKPLGVLGGLLLATRLGWAKLPHGARLQQTFGVCALCGVGFTMSLFIGDIAFGAEAAHAFQIKAGVLAGSLSAIALGAGALWERKAA
jgi:Na+:H+ antiporter, NhaA family